MQNSASATWSDQPLSSHFPPRIVGAGRSFFVEELPAYSRVLLNYSTRYGSIIPTLLLPYANVILRDIGLTTGLVSSYELICFHAISHHVELHGSRDPELVQIGMRCLDHVGALSTVRSSSAITINHQRNRLLTFSATM